MMASACLYAHAAYRYGLRGFYERDAKPITLTTKLIDGIHLKGGTMLVGGHIRRCSRAT